MMHTNSRSSNGEGPSTGSTNATCQQPQTAQSVIPAGIAPHATEVPFAKKLMNMINDERFRGVIGWSADGTSFSILKRDVFKARVLPAYFGSIQLKSFKKRLSRHGFESRQIYTLGREDTAFSHPNFIRDRPELCVLVVPLGTLKMNKKRTRQENEDQPSDNPLSSFTSPSCNTEPSGTQPPALSPVAITTAEDVNAAGAVVSSLQQTKGEATCEHHSSDERPVKRRCDALDTTTQVLMARKEDAGSNTSLRLNSQCLRSAEEIPRLEANEAEPQIPSSTDVPSTDGKVALRHDNVTGEVYEPAQILSSSLPNGSRSLQSQADLCKLEGANQGIIESSTDGSGDSVGSQMSEDGRLQIQHDLEGQSNGSRTRNTVQTSEGCVGNHCGSDKRVQAPEMQQTPSRIHGMSLLQASQVLQPSSTSVDTALFHYVEQQWLQSELQAAAMSAKATFLRDLLLRLSGTQATLCGPGGASGDPFQLQNTDLFQQHLQGALGTIGRGSLVNGLAQQISGQGHSMFPDRSHQSQQNQPLNQLRQTSAAQNANTGGRENISSAYDPVAVVLEVASSLGMKFSS